MNEISFDDFFRVEWRVGEVVSAEMFVEARKFAYILHVDFGPNRCAEIQYCLRC